VRGDHCGQWNAEPARCRQLLRGVLPKRFRCHVPGEDPCLTESGGGGCMSPTPCLPPPGYNSNFYTLKNQGLPGHPGGNVHVPSIFNASNPELELLVYIHGFRNVGT